MSSAADHVGRSEPKQARSRDKYERVLDVADRLFAQLGVEATRITVLAKEAGISISSLYNLFQDRDEVAEALARRYADAVLARQMPVTVASLDGLEAAIAQLIDIEHRQHLENPGYTALMLDAAPLHRSAILRELRNHQIESFCSDLRMHVDCSDEELGTIVTNAVDLALHFLMRAHTGDGISSRQIDHVKWMLMHYVCGRLRPNKPVDWPPSGP